MTLKVRASTILKGTRDHLREHGVTPNAYEDGRGRCCLLGGISKVTYGDCSGYAPTYRSAPWKYCIRACEELLPGWDHKALSISVYHEETGWNLRLPEAVLVKAGKEKDEIADLIFQRAIKLAETDENAEVIQAAKLADAAELIAQGGHCEITVTHDDETALV